MDRGGTHRYGEPAVQPMRRSSTNVSTAARYSASPTKSNIFAGGENVASSTGTVRKSILKHASLIDVHDTLADFDAASHGGCESPEAWFQRILQQKQLSPLDLCDAFCFGDAKRHRHVPLKHVCAVLFDLETSPTTNDPLTEEMEEFLYRFSFDQGDGEIVIDIKEALRTLDIWPSMSSSAASSFASSPGKTTSPRFGKLSYDAGSSVISPAKAAMLQVKTEKLQQVISSLQEQNMQLRQANTGSSPNRRSSNWFASSRAYEGDADRSDELRAPSPLRIAVKKPMAESQSASVASASQRNTTVNRHERELISIAGRLAYGGVKKLEELLRQSDPASTGFVSLKQLRWLLAHELRVEIAETRLMEMCMGMNFNAQGQLDHKEFVHVLTDILLYERPSSSSRGASSRNGSTRELSDVDAAAVAKLREYMRGFHGSRDKSRALLELLCDKYDLEGNQCLALAEMTRVLLHDLAAQHPIKLKCPLTPSETKHLLQSLAAQSLRRPSGSARTTGAMSDSDATFLFYPDVVDAVFDTAASSTSGASSTASASASAWRALQPAFWESLRHALCPSGDASTERKIHQQLCKILLKLDPARSFTVSQRHFHRVFDQHWSARDLDALTDALASPLRGGSGRGTCSSSSSDAHVDDHASSVMLRYDVLMKLLFGAPELRDDASLAAIQRKLQASASSWRERVSAAMAKHGAAHRVPLAGVHELLNGTTTPQQLLTTTETLYLVAALDDLHERKVELRRLWAFLTQSSSPSSSSSASENASLKQQQAERLADAHSVAVLRRYLRLLCDDHELERALEPLGRHESGVVRADQLVHELEAQLRGLRVPSADRAHLATPVFDKFVRSLDDSGADSDHSVRNSSSGVGFVRVSTFLDALFDWRALTTALRLPARLIEAKKTLQVFDWDRDGTLDVDDWPKAWRQLTAGVKPPPSPLRDWELRVLVRRFAGAKPDQQQRRSASRQASRGAIDYARLLVYLLERQQREDRERVTSAVVALLQRKCAQAQHGKPLLTTFHIESAFNAIDSDGKGYFNLGDLRQFVLHELHELDNAQQEQELVALEAHTLRDVRTLLASDATHAGALESVMAFLTGAQPSQQQQGTQPKKVVSLMRFQELMRRNFGVRGSTATAKSRTGRASVDEKDDGDGSEDDDVQGDEDELASSRRRRSSSRGDKQTLQVTTLRELEQCIAELCAPFVDAQGHVAPSLAYAHLNGATGPPPPRRPRSQSPVRTTTMQQSTASLRGSASSASTSSSSSARRSSCFAPPVAIVDAHAMDPLSVARLQHTLRRAHGVAASTHLLSQFFLHIGAANKHFLELPVFAQWLAPLAPELHQRVKQVVKDLLVKSKAGGGQIEIERFLHTLQRRLQDAAAVAIAQTPTRQTHGQGHGHGHPQQHHPAAAEISRVRPSELLSRLHQLNVALRRADLAPLLRHFGMDGQHEIDHVAFIRRLHALAMHA